MEPYDWTDLLTGEFPNLYSEGFQTGAEPTSHERSSRHARQPSQSKNSPGRSPANPFLPGAPTSRTRTAREAAAGMTFTEHTREVMEEQAELLGILAQ